MVIYFVENDDFIMFFTIFQRWESPFFQNLQVAVGLASKSAQDRILLMPAVADRLAYLWNRKAAIPVIDDPQKKKWKSAILCCNSVFFGSSPPSQAIESGDFEVVFTISGTLPSGTQQAACFGIRISWKMERFCGDIWWEYLGILYIWWNIVWETSWDIDRTGWKMATLAGVTWNFNGL